MVGSLAEIQTSKIEPAIWKLERVDNPDDARAIVAQAQIGGRKAGVITLGRGESKELVPKMARDRRQNSRYHRIFLRKNNSG